MSEGELLSLAVEQGSLTDAALSVLNEELEHRGLGESEIESWKHPPVAVRRPRQKSRWDRKSRHWKAQIRRLYNRLPFSPFWVISLLYVAFFRWLIKWARGQPEIAGLGFLAVTVATLVIVILLPARPGK